MRSIVRSNPGEGARYFGDLICGERLSPNPLLVKNGERELSSLTLVHPKTLY
jgi:hypothetical protein